MTEYTEDALIIMMEKGTPIETIRDIHSKLQELPKLKEKYAQLKYDYDKNLNELAKLSVDHKILERIKQHNEITSTGFMCDLEQENQKLKAEIEELKKKLESKN